MAREVKLSEATAALRRVYFQLVETDGITPALSEAGGQPEITTSAGSAWSATGIGVLVAVGNGRYYAVLTQAALASAGLVIETRYKSAGTAECPGDTVVVTRDPYGESVAAILAGITASGVEVVWSSVVPADGGEVSIVNGDDYLTSRGRALTWDVATDADLDGATWTLRIYDGPRESDGVALTVSASAVATATGYTVSAELTAAQTAALDVRMYARRSVQPRRYEVVAVISGAIETQFSDVLLVTE